MHRGVPLIYRRTRGCRAGFRKRSRDAEPSQVKLCGGKDSNITRKEAADEEAAKSEFFGNGNVITAAKMRK